MPLLTKMSQNIGQIVIKLSICMLIILIMMISKSTSTPNLLGYFCSNTTIANNSQYQAKLNTLFHFLSSNATNTSGFHQAISSDANSSSENVYGSFLCRGDLNASLCQECVTTATTIDFPKSLCPNHKEAIIWYDECMVRYSNVSYFGQVDSSPSWILWNLNNATDNITRLMETMANMMNNIIVPTAAAGDQLKKFAAYYAEYNDFQTIYGLGQCTPDLSSFDCSVCLSNAISSFRATRGGRVLMPSCFVRYETYLFFNSSQMSPGRHNATGKVTNITITNNCNYTVWPATTGNTDTNVNVHTGFSLAKGHSKTISFQSNQEVRVWGRTLCSDDSGSFSCQTGDCGTDRIDCEGTSFKHPATVAYFSINQITNKDTYDVRVNYGYNLQMMVAPNGGNGDRCNVTGCVFNLNRNKCSPEYSVMDGKNSMIGCNNPCDVEVQGRFCCQNSSLCDSSEYSLIPSMIFNASCPRAHITPFDGSTTRFSCDNNQGSSYTVMFCPPPNMIRLSIRFQKS